MKVNVRWKLMGSINFINSINSYTHKHILLIKL